MIQANELRIGNKVNLIALDQIIEIESVNRVSRLSGLFTWIEKEEEYEDSITAIEPISLTHEILEKCGLKHWDNDWYFIKTSWIELSVNIDSGEICIQNGAQIFSKKNLVCKYLHQLQNLYYALTQTELNIQL